MIYLAGSKHIVSSTVIDSLVEPASSGHLWNSRFMFCILELFNSLALEVVTQYK